MLDVACTCRHLPAILTGFFVCNFRSTMATRRGMYTAGEDAELLMNCDSGDNEELFAFEALFYACGFIKSLSFHACLFSYIDFVTNIT